MTKKTTRVYTLDELKEKSQQASCYRRLREIVQTAPLNKDGKINLSWVNGEAEKYLHEENEQIGSLQTIEKLRKSTRVLAILRRDFTEEFVKLVSERNAKILGERNKTSKPKNIPIQTKKFSLPISTDAIVTLRKMPDFTIKQDVELQFWGSSAINFCNSLLSALLEDSFSEPPYQLNSASERINELKQLTIQLLEEKFGLSIKSCDNCGQSMCMFKTFSKKMDYKDRCFWTPKEVPEKKEN